MADNNAPRGRRRTDTTVQGQDVHKRGEGLGTGKVGSSSGYQGRPGTTGNRPQSSGGTRAGGAGGLIGIVVIIAALIFGGKGLLGGLTGGGSTSSTAADGLTMSSSSAMSGMDLFSLFGSFAAPSSFSQVSGAGASSASSSAASAASGWNTSPNTTASTVPANGWVMTPNTGKLNTAVDSGARAKYTTIKGNGQDTVTLMVYMCGTDLESKNGMATNDLVEMTKANLSSSVNVIVYTGGCKQWKNSVISSSKNQIYKVEKGGLTCLVKDDGTGAMTSPDTLSSFIRWCAKNYPANRNMLVFWDHGGGSISGYGYDEKNSRAGSMNLTGVNKALYDGGVKFDMIGFDCCLMATAENALMCSDYGDYMVASEETEPGVGWYYTNWLSTLSANPSIPTLELGKQIVDDFVDVCRQTCGNQMTTLSVIDLAELEHTFPAELKSFAQNTISMIQNDSYRTVSNARGNTREFATSSKIDQVDLVHLAANIGSAEGKSMTEAILNAVKYNRTSTSINNAYGLSIFFPYRKTSSVSNAVKINEVIGMDADYNRCIQAFASMGAGGQAVSSSAYSGASGGSSYGSAGSPLGSLLGSLGGAATSTSSSASGMSADMIGSLLGSLMGSSDFFGRSMNDTLDADTTALYLADNQFDADLVWLNGSDGIPEMKLTDKQWSLVSDLALNVFYDDGEGFLDLGLDNVYFFKEDGALVGAYDGAWLSINGQAVAYYFEGTEEDEDGSFISHGRIPILANGTRAELLTSVTESPSGSVTASVDGLRWIYPDIDDANAVVAKADNGELRMTDGSSTLTIDFICDYYSYGGDYLNTYQIGEPVKLKGTVQNDEIASVDGEGTESQVVVYDLSELTLADAYFNAEKMSATYRFTDIYGQTYWTPVMQ